MPACGHHEHPEKKAAASGELMPAVSRKWWARRLLPGLLPFSLLFSSLSTPIIFELLSIMVRNTLCSVTATSWSKMSLEARVELKRAVLLESIQVVERELIKTHLVLRHPDLVEEMRKRR